MYQSLYEKRHFIVNISQKSNSTDSNFHLDESQEVLIIRDVKRVSPNNASVINSIPPWIMVIGGAFSTISTSVGLVWALQRNEAELDSESVSRGDTACKRKYEREKRTATNIKHMLYFRQERQLLSDEHMGLTFITNVLSVPPLELTHEVAASLNY